MAYNEYLARFLFVCPSKIELKRTFINLFFIN